MTDTDGTGPNAASRGSIGDRLRAELISAMKARRTDAVAALRTMIAALDNAEAVEPVGRADEVTSVHVAGAGAGVGSTEAVRRSLTDDARRAVLAGLIDERLAEAATLDAHDRTDAATQLRDEAELVSRYLSRVTADGAAPD